MNDTAIKKLEEKIKGLEERKEQLGSIYHIIRENLNISSDAPLCNGDISSSGFKDKIEILEKEGSEMYKEILPSTHLVYSSWPKPKQVKIEREVSPRQEYDNFIIEMFKDIRAGKTSMSMHSDGSIVGLPLRRTSNILRRIVDEDKNPDNSDPYYDRIKDTVVILPQPSNDINLLKEDGNGYLKRYFKQNECLDIRHSSFTAPRKLKQLVNSLVGNNVIFYPIISEREYNSFESVWGSKIEIPFSFEIGDSDKESKYGRKITGGKVLAEVFSPFEQEDAEYVANFFQRNILKSYSTCAADYLKNKFTRKTYYSSPCCCG